MYWLINNSDVIVGVVALLFVIIVTVIKFLLMSRDKQLEKVKEWLLYACIEAEKSLGNQTGEIKLRYVYNEFIEKFKFVSMFLSFEDFSDLVDSSLEDMRELVDTNGSIRDYINKK